MVQKVKRRGIRGGKNVTLCQKREIAKEGCVSLVKGMFP